VLVLVGQTLNSIASTATGGRRARGGRRLAPAVSALAAGAWLAWSRISIW